MWEIIRSNKRKSVLLVLFMAILLLSVGYAAGELLIGPQHGPIGLAAAFVIWAGLTITAYFQGKNLFMAMSNAQQIQKEDHPQLFNVVEEMKIASQLPVIPEIYIIDDPAPNAFAAGRDPGHCAVAVTSGLLNRLNRDELQGVIAHEVGHIKNRDILFMTMLGVMMGAIVMISDITLRSISHGHGRRRRRTSQESNQAQAIIAIVGLILILLAPIMAQAIYLAASRRREFLADASSVQFTRYPEGLASALEKIAYSPIKMKQISKAIAPLFIVNPIQALTSRAINLFSTHPPIEKRIQILRNIVGGAGFSHYNQAFQTVMGQSSIIPRSAMQEPSPPVSRDHTAESATPPLDTGRTFIETITSTVAADAAQPSIAGRVRETTDAIWKSRGYQFIHCPCGAILKIPPIFKRPAVRCLRCKREHSVPGNATH